ncbi:MAG: nucleoside-triphosphatase [Candidatus Kariarchaeaceae archaeon]|jgi:nucleoside-triphosphatase
MGIRHLFLQGSPGSGKTTLIVKLIERYQLSCDGFYTKEVRRVGKRVGFDVCILDNSVCIPLARVGQGSVSVGKYTVFVEEFTKFIQKYSFNSPTIIIDEIGKMELKSTYFTGLIKELAASKQLIATIPRTTLPIIDEIIEKHHVDIVDLTHNTRNQTWERMCAWLEKNMSF